MRFRDYAIRRALQIPFTLFFLSILIFYVTRVMPGDPVRLYLGLEATEKQVQMYRKLFGLDKPLYLQYIDYWKNLFLHGKLGLSLYTSRDVAKDIADYLPATLELVVTAMIFSIIVGVVLGVVSAMYRNKWVDHLLRVAAIAGVSMPRFWVGILLQLAISYYLGILPISGRMSTNIMVHRITGFLLIDTLIQGNFHAFIDVSEHMILPVLALSFSPIAQIMRLVRASLLEEMEKPYTSTLRALGFPRNLVYYKYMLRNALVVAVTIIGLLFGFFIYGAFAIEMVFGWPGIGWYAVKVGLAKDFNAIVAVVMLIGLIYTVTNYIVDISYAYLDPRIRLKMEVK